MRAACLALLVALAGGTACGSGGEPRAKAPAGSGTPAADTTATRLLTPEECQQLGQSIAETCRGSNSRSAVMEGWCSDTTAGVSSGSWVSDCEKHIRYVDGVCFSSNDSVKGLMDCDSAVAR